MTTLSSTCPVCSSPMPLGAYGILEHGQMVHPQCRASADSVNLWPEGIRHLSCLSCGRDFESVSKVQRTCRACRSKRAA